MTKTRMLLDSVERRDTAEVAAWIAAGAPPNGSRVRRLVNYHEPTPLIAAVLAEALDIVALLLDHGANPDLDTATWQTPLAIACWQGHRAMVELLLERGADVNGGRTRHGGPLENAAWYAHGDLVALLLERGADPQRVMARGPGSLCRISTSILVQLINAGGRAPPEIVDMLAAEQCGDRPKAT